MINLPQGFLTNKESSKKGESSNSSKLSKTQANNK